MGSLESFFWRYRNLLAGLPLVPAFLFTSNELEADWLVWPLAIALVALGVALRAWSSRHCWYAQRRPRRLVTTGPYARIRNPLYAGNIVIITGATVASELVWLLPPVIVWAFLVYSRVVRDEEQRLETCYGDAWKAYRERVPTWIPRPRLRASRSPSEPWSPGSLLLALARQGRNFLVLVPFAIKEINPFDIWWHP